MTNAERYKTVQERLKAFFRYSYGREFDSTKWSHEKCAFEWLELEAKKEKPLPCPICSRDVRLHHDSDNKVGICCDCGYHGKWCDTEDEAIVEHNIVANKCTEK